MTRNQIEYWRNVETARTNLAQETETNRANMARENETHRSNVRNELEMNRSNRTREQETERHNRATESQNQKDLALRTVVADRDFHMGLRTLSETARHNKAVEGENQRSNKAREYLSKLESDRNYEVKRRQQSTADYNAMTQRYNVEEGKRSHQANEGYALLNLAEAKRSNQARELETQRHNVSQESISKADQSIRRSELSEKRRSNMAQEANVRRGQDFQLLGTLVTAGTRSISSINPKNTKRRIAL